MLKTKIYSFGVVVTYFLILSLMIKYVHLSLKSLKSKSQIKINPDKKNKFVRIRILKQIHFTFRRCHATSFIQRRLDYFFISHILQDSVKNTNTWSENKT